MKILIIAFVIFAVGVLMGDRFADPEIEYIDKPRTVIVKEPAPPAEIRYQLADSCELALDYATQIINQATEVDAKSTQQLDIIALARQAIAAGDPNMLTDAENKQRDLQGSTVDSIERLSELTFLYEKAKTDCEKRND